MTTPTEAAEHNIALPEPGEEPDFLPHPLLDHLLEAVIALGAELWVERDRRRTTEALLERKGLLTRAEIEAFLPGPEEERDRQDAKEALVERTLGKLTQLGS